MAAENDAFQTGSCVKGVYFLRIMREKMSPADLENGQEQTEI